MSPKMRRHQSSPSNETSSSTLRHVLYLSYNIWHRILTILSRAQKVASTAILAEVKCCYEREMYQSHHRVYLSARIMVAATKGDKRRRGVAAVRELRSVAARDVRNCVIMKWCRP